MFCIIREFYPFPTKGYWGEKLGIVHKVFILLIGENEQFCLVWNQLYLVLDAVLHGEVKKEMEGNDVVRNQDSIVSENNGRDGCAPDRNSQVGALCSSGLLIVVNFIFIRGRNSLHLVQDLFCQILAPLVVCQIHNMSVCSSVFGQDREVCVHQCQQ